MDQATKKIFLLVPLKIRFEKWNSLLQENVPVQFYNYFFLIIPDIICSSSDGRLCFVKSSSGKVKVRIDDLFPSKSTIGAFVNLDDEDKLLAVGNDDGDVKVIS